MSRTEQLEMLYKASLELQETFLNQVNYAKSALSAKGISALNDFHSALNALKEKESD